MTAAITVVLTGTYERSVGTRDCPTDVSVTGGTWSSNCPCLSSDANAVSPSTQSSPHWGLLLSAATLASNGPVLSSSSLNGVPVAFWTAWVTTLSPPRAEYTTSGTVAVVPPATAGVPPHAASAPA